jgi:hypothetical protein
MSNSYVIVLSKLIIKLLFVVYLYSYNIMRIEYSIRVHLLDLIFNFIFNSSEPFQVLNSHCRATNGGEGGRLSIYSISNPQNLE